MECVEERPPPVEGVGRVDERDVERARFPGDEHRHVATDDVGPTGELRDGQVGAQAREGRPGPVDEGHPCCTS